MDLTQQSVAALSAAVRTKKISAVEVTKHFLERVRTLDQKLNSFISVNEKSLEEAAAIDARLAHGEDPGVLTGVPIAIKDALCTEGLRTTAASNALRNFIPPYSATVVKRLKEAGAVVLGKTNLDEFAMGSSNETSAFGPVRNPWNPDYVPGGSSGGSAAALAARLAPGAIGTDTGGSIRQPASFCGVYGMKPTYGRVSRYGVIAYASSLDQVGPMANSTEDCALLLEAIAGECSHDATSAQIKVPNWTKELSSEGELKGICVGLPKEFFESGLEKDVRQAVERAVKTIKDLGAEVVEVSLPLARHAVAVYYLIATSEASSNLARYDGIRYGHRANFHEAPAFNLEEFYSRTRGEAFGVEVKRRIMLGTYALSSGYYDAYYRKASQVRRLLRDQFIEAFKTCDVIISPVATSPAFKIGDRISDPMAMYMNDVFTTSANLAGLPGMSVPAGFSENGLPIGVQLLAKHFDESRLFRVSLGLERGLDLQGRKPHVI